MNRKESLSRENFIDSQRYFRKWFSLKQNEPKFQEFRLVSKNI
jgi:hypothetical protein